MNFRLIAMSAVLMAAAQASARVVYDASQAMLENVANGVSGMVNPFTDSKGGEWKWFAADDQLSSSGNTALTAYERTTHYPAFGYSRSRPWIAVNNIADGDTAECAGSNLSLALGDMVFHPEKAGANNNRHAGIRFTVPEAGWYAVEAFARLVVDGDASDGVNVGLVINGTDTWFSGCRNSDYNGFRKTAGITTGYHYFAAGTTIDFVVGNGGNGNISSDSTLVRFKVLREEAGEVSDFTRDFTANLAANNPAGAFTGSNGGHWSIVRALADESESADLSGNNFWQFGTAYERAVSKFKGLQPTGGGTWIAVNASDTKRALNAQEPGVGYGIAGVNATATNTAHLAGGEVFLLPPNNVNMVVRFRPPQAGFYSGTVYVRDLGHEKGNGANDGIQVKVSACREALANLPCGYEDGGDLYWRAIEIPKRLLTADEWIDIQISSRNNQPNDVTAFSATFVRETGDFADAGRTLSEMLATKNAANNPFTDSNHDQWEYGYRAAILGDGALTKYTQLQANFYQNTGLYAWAINNGLPRITANMAGEPVVYSVNGANPWPVLYPGVYYTHPATGNIAVPVVRWHAPADGVYRVHGMARDIAKDTGSGDGVTRAFAVAGNVIDLCKVSLEESGAKAYEVSDAPLVFLKAGEWIDSALAQGANNASDSTFLTFAIAPEANPFAGKGALNLRFGGVCTARPRLGWSDEAVWTSVTSDRARTKLANGTSVTAGVAFGAGTTVTTGLPTNGSAMQEAGLVAAAGETKSFTLTGLKADAAYTLAVYSLTTAAQTTAAPVLTVNGAAATVSAKLATYGILDSVLLYEAAADADGRIACAFTAPSDTARAVVNAVQVFGEFDEYSGLTIIVR